MLLVFLATAAFLFAYFPILYDLRDQILGNELAHHAPIVIALAAYLFYQRWEQIAWEARTVTEGPWCLLLGLGLNLLGQWIGIYYLSQLSIPLSLYGVLRYGKGRQAADRAVFPILFLLLAFPIPGKVYMDVVFPLKLAVTEISSVILMLLGYPVRTFGNIMEIGTALIGVDDACSGLNSLMAMFTLSIFFSSLVIRTLMYRWLIVVSMIPVVMLANIVRVATTALAVVHWGPAAAEGLLHTLWGIGTFGLALMGLLGVTKSAAALERGRKTNG